MNLRRRLLDRPEAPLRILLKELSAFGAVGVVNLVLDVALFNALHFGAGLGPLTAKVISAAITTTCAYFMNRHWSFSHRARSGLAREYTLFFLLNAVGLVINLAVLGGARYGLDLTDKLSINAANLVGVGLATVFRFWSYKRWVFPPHQEQEPPSVQRAAA